MKIKLNPTRGNVTRGEGLGGGKGRTVNSSDRTLRTSYDNVIQFSLRHGCKETLLSARSKQNETLKFDIRSK